ncbi:hypothetical protein FJ987_05865 [Mesorhizobium sp. CU2]|uniref:hypothetical protein n=1 Tax=unclassified Mesorhizobium TaxID=325217 RepID=UPI00112D3857|nr:MULTISPECIES: hypothetical protein [unclassified Mesorhizobium]TPN79590.1 hypothetical protein FJ988_23040 [Mesorhizobium sp. CU3]TPO20063.1 hypothetical protein FJ987_05865 [Mesorhizobium sp. CU2]
MKHSIGLALVLLLAMCSCSFAASDFLRVSVECPNPDGNGVLKTIDEKPNGSESRVSTSYIGGQVDRVTVASSQDGSNFKDRFTLSRLASAGTKELPAFRAFEDRANELLRFFCNATPEEKQRYLDLLQANRALLQQLKAH